MVREPQGRPADVTAGLAGRPWFAANEVLAFLLELAALVLLGRWGFAEGGGAVGRVLLGLGLPTAAAVLWGLFAAPKARHPLLLPGVLVVKALVLGGSAAALYGLGHPAAAGVLAAVIVLNTALAETFRRRPAPASDADSTAR
ncbi:YrdB family protein [Streptomyces sp. NRRL B-24484]|uniref:YrdB family protein n=1 Tax=Streptomyces sp. NRRL B-24484 TaxID=1463833 RepID=UPI0019013238|nr:YrdB family protein [Streptomyces sp. NRRL B-24484]